MSKKHGSLLRDELVARPLSEWHEDDGTVLWWRFPVDEPPYVGTPNTLGQTVEVSVASFGVDKVMRFFVGGWPGYHTHWTKITVPLITLPEDARSHAAGAEPSSASQP